MKPASTSHRCARISRHLCYYRPHLEALEDRLLLSISLVPSPQSPHLVGQQITWTATDDTGRAVYGEEDPQDAKAPGNAWVGGLLHTAKHEGYEKLRDELQAWRAALRGASQVKAGELLLNYVTDRREMIQYPKFQEMGRQIGSGPTESMCKATTQRIKGRGMRWDGDNAESIMALEALEQSGAWQAYWELQLAMAA
jgi:hypothetical protein